MSAPVSMRKSSFEFVSGTKSRAGSWDFVVLRAVAMKPIASLRLLSFPACSCKEVCSYELSVRIVYGRNTIRTHCNGLSACSFVIVSVHCVAQTDCGDVCCSGCASVHCVAQTGCDDVCCSGCASVHCVAQTGCDDVCCRGCPCSVRVCGGPMSETYLEMMK